MSFHERVWFSRSLGEEQRAKGKRGYWGVGSGRVSLVVEGCGERKGTRGELETQIMHERRRQQLFRKRLELFCEKWEEGAEEVGGVREG